MKILSETQNSWASIILQVFYVYEKSNSHSEEFLYDGNIDKSEMTICKTVPEKLFNAPVKKVDIQQHRPNKDVWKSKGVLVQDMPSGKICYNRLEKTTLKVR